MARSSRVYDAAPAPSERPSAGEQALAAESNAAMAGGTPDQREAAAKRRSAAHGDTEARRLGFVDALLVERRGYVQRGRTDRVAQVDAELERHGNVVERGAKA